MLNFTLISTYYDTNIMIFSYNYYIYGIKRSVMPAFTIRYSAELEPKFESLKTLFKQSTKNKVIIDLINQYPLLNQRYDDLSQRHDDLLAKHWELLTLLQQKEELNQKVEQLMTDLV